jgi:zinc transport system substrate-binding protein
VILILVREVRRVAWRGVAGLVVAGVVAGTLANAAPGVAAPAGAAAATRRERVAVVAAFYPVAFAAEEVGGRRVAVTNLTPAGAEPHDLELTPRQRDQIEDAALVLVMGSGFQPAVEQAARSRKTGTVEVLRRLPVATAGRRVADAHAGDRATRGDPLDPHVWLDPTLMVAMVDVVEAALVRTDPAGRATYAANADRLRERLAALDARYRAGLADCDRRLLVTAHEAFGYLAAAYGLEQQGVAGLSPDEDPNPRRLAALADLAQRRGVTTVFTEELVSPRIARTLAREAGGLRTDVLNPLEGLTAKQVAAGDDYVSVMDRNLAKLRRALGCR